MDAREYCSRKSAAREADACGRRKRLSISSGGACETFFELLNAAYYWKYRTTAATDGNYPFSNIKFRNAKVVWDEYVPDVFTGVASTATYGSAYFINPEFFKLKVEEETNFTMTEFAKPVKGDSRLAHILFMGQLTLANRRKHGIYGKIPRTLTAA